MQLVAMPEAALRNGTEHIARLNCGHLIMIDGDFRLDDEGRISWLSGGRAPSQIIFFCPLCPPGLAHRVAQVWKVGDDR